MPPSRPQTWHRPGQIVQMAVFCLELSDPPTNIEESQMGAGTVGRCREGGQGGKADRSEAEISKPVHPRYCQEHIRTQERNRKGVAWRRRE